MTMSSGTTEAGAVSGDHRWRFFRCGGVDQVTFQSGADIANLEGLDLKLWISLAMPTAGVEVDARTLAWIDTDKDGRVRPPELLAAVAWARGAFVDLDPLVKGGDVVALSNIRAEGIKKGAQRILSNLGKAEEQSIALADVDAAVKEFSKTRLNGDGVVPPGDAEDEVTGKDLADVVLATGGVTDRSGQMGVDQAGLVRFLAEAKAWVEWQDKGQGEGVLVAGEGTGAAWGAVEAVRGKVVDFFARCRLAAFDRRALGALNRQEAEYLAIAAQDLKVTSEEVSGFPLAMVEAGRELPLREGLNPAWGRAMELLLNKAVKPLLGDGVQSLSEEQWVKLQALVAPYGAWQAAKPGTGVEKLGGGRLREMLSGDLNERVSALIAKDAALAPEYAQIVEVEKLVRFQRDLVRLLNNTVNFADFYGRRGAVFQSGRLYLDARCCDLCVDVVDAGKHAALAGLAGMYLAYCDCSRPGMPKRTIVAVFTNGDADNLMVGRNGVFYDRQGRDWDATITKVVANPISLREAFWSPYKKFLRMVEEMVAKRAAAADAAADKKLAAAATSVTTADAAKPAGAQPKKIDVGTVAAMGVAVGAIGAAVTGLATGLMKLQWWQIPLVFVGILLLISLPSMVMAWLKLRRRNLAPLLDANGWAINTRARVNTAFGAALTHLPQMPAGASRALEDPFQEKRRPWGLYLFLVVLVAGAVWVRVDHHRRGHYFWVQPAADGGTNALPAEVEAGS